MIVGFGSTNERYRDRTRDLKVFSLISKKCACGKPCAAKQLVQYGKCIACVRAHAQSPQLGAAVPA